MRVSRRRLGYLVRPRPWWLVVRAAAWRISADSTPVPPLSWPLDGLDLDAITVRWPTRYAWPNVAKWLDPLKLGISQHVRVVPTEIAQHEGNLAIFEVVSNGQVLRVGVDCEDRSVLHPMAADTDLYFKLEYARGGYGSAHVVPGGYISPKLSLYRHAGRWRQYDPDVAVYGRLGTQYNGAQRSRIISALQRQDLFTFRGGTSPRPWLEYIDELSRSRIGIDVPGRGQFCYRLVESFAVGTCVVGVDLGNELHVPIGDARIAVAEDEIVETCRTLLSDEPRRANVAARGADFFDRYLSLRQLGAYYLHSSLAHMTAATNVGATLNAPKLIENPCGRTPT